MDSRTIIMIASSAGGPQALKRVFAGLPLLKACIVVVQHMPRFVNDSLAKDLGGHTEMKVAVARHGDRVEHGKIYLAPSKVHLSLVANRAIELAGSTLVNYVCPAADVAMRSLKVMPGDRIIGIVLTGMGKDGAGGLVHIKNIGGTTIAQNKESCMVYGMPRAAAETGSVDMVLCPEDIRDTLVKLSSR